MTNTILNTIFALIVLTASITWLCVAPGWEPGITVLSTSGAFIFDAIAHINNLKEVRVKIKKNSSLSPIIVVDSNMNTESDNPSFLELIIPTKEEINIYGQKTRVRDLSDNGEIYARNSASAIDNIPERIKFITLPTLSLYRFKFVIFILFLAWIIHLI